MAPSLLFDHRQELNTAVADVLAHRMRRRMHELDWDVERCRLELEAAGAFDTAVRDSQLRLVRYWTSKTNPHAPRGDRPWRVLADAEPRDPTLVKQVDRIRSFASRQATAERYYGLCLVRALEQAPNRSESEAGRASNARSDRASAWLLATDLVASALEQSKMPRTVYVDAPGFETTLGASGLEEFGSEWRRTLRHALEEGWTVIHVMSWHGTGDEVLHPAVQADLVLNLLFAAWTPGTYQPVLGATSGPEHIVAVENHAAVGIWDAHHEGGSPRKVSVPLHGAAPESTLAARVANSFVEHARTLPPARALPPLWTYRLEDDTYLSFHMSLAAEEAEPNARRYMFKAWPPPVAAVPDQVWESSIARLLDVGPEEKRPYVAMHRELLRKRQKAFLTATERSSSTPRFQDIVTVRGVEEYLGIGVSGPASRGGDLLSLSHLTLDERCDHVRHLAGLVRDRPGYRLALVEEEALLVEAHPLWWIVVTNDSPRKGAIFFAEFGRDEQAERRGAWLHDAATTNLVEGFVSLFEGLWETLPDDSRNPEDVAERLVAMADMATM